MHNLTVQSALEAYLRVVEDSRSESTARTYRQATRKFTVLLEQQLGLNTNEVQIGDVSEHWVKSFLDGLRHHAPATEQLYLTALIGYYEFLAAEYEAPLNMTRIRSMVRRRQRRVTPRLPKFPRAEIEQLIEVVGREASMPCKDVAKRLRRLRAKAFILTLADTGLRIAEACSITRGQLDWDEHRAVVTIKGGRESVVRFSSRSVDSIRTYLQARAPLDGGSGRPLSALPLFARHDKGAGKRVLGLGTVGARSIVHRSVEFALGSDARGAITPHSFRHYYVTVVLRASGGNLRLAQELARHKNIAITERYAHLSDGDLDRGYHEIFNKT